MFSLLYCPQRRLPVPNKERFDFLIYNSAEEEVSVNAVVHDETIWLTQKAMAELFDVGVPAINKHLRNIFEEGELDANVVISKMKQPLHMEQ